MEESIDFSFFEDPENDSSWSTGKYYSSGMSSALDVRQESNFVGLLNQGATVCF